MKTFTNYLIVLISIIFLSVGMIFVAKADHPSLEEQAVERAVRDARQREELFQLEAERQRRIEAYKEIVRRETARLREERDKDGTVASL